MAAKTLRSLEQQQLNLRVAMPHFLVELHISGPVPEDVLLAQRAFLRELTDKEALLIGGMRLDQAGRGLAILKASSQAEAAASYEAAPVVVNGLATVKVSEFRVTAGPAQFLTP